MDVGLPMSICIIISNFYGLCMVSWKKIHPIFVLVRILVVLLWESVSAQKKSPRFHWFNGLVLLGNFTGKPLFIPFFEWENNSGFRLRLDFPNKTNPLNGGIIIPQYDYTISLLIQKKIEVCTSWENPNDSWLSPGSIVDDLYGC